MGLRILVLDTYYQPFLDAHYAERPELERASYREQLTSLMARSFGTSDAYGLHLREHGHEAWDIVVNCEPLQLRWAEEHGHAALARALRRLPAGRARAAARQVILRRVLALQVAALEPDVVYVQDMHWATRPDLALLKRRGRSLVGQIATAPPAQKRFDSYDLILTSFPHYVERYRALGIDTEYLAIAFDERVLDRLRAEGIDPSAGARRERCAVFAGTIHPPDVHRQGMEFAERIAAAGVEFWGHADALPPGSPVWSRHRGEAWGLDMYRVLASARIAVNRHGDIAEGSANNMRLFEATGVGALMLTEFAPNLPDLFTPGAEVVAYSSLQDLVDKIRHYSSNPEDARAIAAAGQKRTLAEHTYARRIGQLAQILEDRLG